MKEITIYKTLRIGNETFAIPQKAFKNGRRQVFKTEKEARTFLSEFIDKSNVEG